MSFQIEIDEKSAAGTDLIRQAVREMRRVFATAKNQTGATQQSIAKKLGLRHRSIVNRWLAGKDNIGLRTIGELAWALDKRAVITFVDCDEVGGNFFEIEETEQKDAAFSRVERSVGGWRNPSEKFATIDVMLENG